MRPLLGWRRFSNLFRNPTPCDPSESQICSPQVSALQPSLCVGEGPTPNLQADDEPVSRSRRCSFYANRPIAIAVGILVTRMTDRASPSLPRSGEFVVVANAAPVMMWLSRADGWRTFFNKKWLDFTRPDTGQ